MKEITIEEFKAPVLKNIPFLIIDMASPVDGWEDYPDFHKGSKCSVNGFPYDLMYCDGVFSLDACCIGITAWRRNVIEPKINYRAGDAVYVVALNGKNVDPTIYEFKIPDRVYTMQSFTLL